MYRLLEEGKIVVNEVAPYYCHTNNPNTYTKVQLLMLLIGTSC